MGNGLNGKLWAALGAVIGCVAVLRLVVRRIRNSHYQLVSASGEALLEAAQRQAEGAGEPQRTAQEPEELQEKAQNAAAAENGQEADAIDEDRGKIDTGKAAKVWDRYPRPQMRRDSFYNLNGNWELDGRRILVPFPPQSFLSGYRGNIGKYLNYSREFVVSEKKKDSRILLHFGAVDQVAEVFLNGHYLGKHEGGYLPFYFDVTEYVKEGTNRIDVKAADTLSALYPYGKQRKARGGMWYTPVSGIWQSVWMECVPQVYIADLKITADTEKVRISVRLSEEAAVNGITITITLHDGSRHTVQTAGTEAEIDLTKIRLADGRFYQPCLWNTQNPYLYEMTVRMGEDTVSSYFGLRTIEVKKAEGIPRVCLNGEPVFLQGVLDQGYFCDGIYLPAKEEEYEQDVLRMKALGMNLLRKHIKIEPECFYYYCDVHGMLVMQDMVNNGSYSWIRDTALPTLGFCRKKDKESWHGNLHGRERRAFFIRHMKETIRHLYNHPCIIAYTIFNEGWGQFESDVLYRQAKELDDTRLYDATSGWFTQKDSDFDSQHIYFKKLEIPEIPEKPVLVSECGGYSLRVPGHFYAKYTRYGYGECKDQTELTNRVRRLYKETILPEVPRGLCGCIYTQLSDVEDEVNGFYTYDRKVCKVEPESMQEIAAKLSETVSAGK